MVPMIEVPVLVVKNGEPTEESPEPNGHVYGVNPILLPVNPSSQLAPHPMDKKQSWYWVNGTHWNIQEPYDKMREILRRFVVIESTL